MSFLLRQAARRSFSSATHGRTNPYGMFREDIVSLLVFDRSSHTQPVKVSPLPDIIAGLAVSTVTVIILNEVYRKPQIRKLEEFHAKLKKCRQQGIFDREEI